MVSNGIKVSVNSFSAKKAGAIIRTLSCFSDRSASKHVTADSKGQGKILTSGYMTLIRSCGDRKGQ